MTRKLIPVDMDKLRACIESAEANGPLANRSRLYEEVNDRMQSLGEYECNPQVVMLRINKYEIPIKTPKGRRGRQKGEKLGISIPSKRKRRMAEDVHAALRRAVPAKYRKVVDRAAGGSLKAYLALTCLDCGNYQPNEIRLCGCTTCPLYSIRPYRTNEEKAAYAMRNVREGEENRELATV